ncbi:hypothetical protein FRB99_008796 [Tulasnella sp. 403]|nr:hypothetical protein FRB99_008796 [Tulasnella sp. 403]
MSLPSVSSNSIAKRGLATKPSDSSAYDTEYWFDQLIDHTNPAAGTFKQRYFFSNYYWKGEGSPIVIATPGEQSAEGFYVDLTGASMQHALMASLGAAGIVLEHRYWGKSSPYPDLTAQHLQYLTVEQAIEDTVYFAQNVQLPWNGTKFNTSPYSVPWVQIGCSYPGLLVSYTQEKYPSLFAAGWATSAPIQADGDFWEYWEPIEEGLPKNCSTDLATSTEYIDTVLKSGNAANITALKTKFGLESLQDDDFATTLTYPFNKWQDLQPTDYSRTGEPLIYKFCDAIERNPTTNSTNTAATGLGLPMALDNWAAAFKALGPDQDCPGTGGACYSTYNYDSPSYTNTSNADDLNRGWTWLLCTELGWFQIGDPGNSSSIVSQFDSSASALRMCDHMFTNPDGTPGNFSASTVGKITSEFSGWNIVVKNLYVVNGEFDPWRSASLSSRWAPSFQDTATQEITVIPQAKHCWDRYLANTLVNTDVRDAQQLGITKIYGWLQDWYQAHTNITSHLPKTAALAADFNATLDALQTDDGVINDLKDQVHKLAGNRTLALSSFAMNLLLIIAVTVGGVMLVKEKKAGRATQALKGGGSTIALMPTQWAQQQSDATRGAYKPVKGPST